MLILLQLVHSLYMCVGYLFLNSTDEGCGEFLKIDLEFGELSAPGKPCNIKLVPKARNCREIIHNASWHRPLQYTLVPIELRCPTTPRTVYDLVSDIVHCCILFLEPCFGPLPAARLLHR